MERQNTRAQARASTSLTLLRRLGVAAVAAALVSPIMSVAQTESSAPRFQRLTGVHVPKGTKLPLQKMKGQQVTVVLRMAGDSIAEARAATADHRISAAQSDSIRQSLARQHAGLMGEIGARGGKVLAQYHAALNGIKVRINADQVASLKSLSGVVDVLAVRTYHISNAQSVPFIGAPQAWQTTGFRGEHEKIAVIDTGIDYTHANFGGPGTVEAYQAALATDTAAPDPTMFGPNAPKVKGGTDLVGDDYDADPNDPGYQPVPHPDPNPLDCNGHGSHTAGTAAGMGVTAAGTTYTGPYNTAAYTTPGFSIGPGVAPKADLYSVRVFGCNGSASTDVIVDAIDWAIDNDMDVVSMSLGSDVGEVQDADAVASTNATLAGVIVVAASGNAGPVPYVTSTPGVSGASISVAAIDSHLSYPGVSLALNDGTIEAQNSNGVSSVPAPGGVVVLRNSDGTVSLGCDESEYVDSLIAGKLVVTLRGVCARVDRATFGAAHGAAAVAMINTSPGYPPFEGTIPNVSIPFLGVLSSDGATIAGATNVSSYTANTVANPTYRQAASFSSGGPRAGDSFLKPNVAAPGVSIVSTGFGTGNGSLVDSGTSMATPHVAGVAALAAQAHPSWSERAVSAAVVETADPTQLTDYTPGIEGAGLVQALGATRTQAVVIAEGDGGEHAISFGFDEFLWNFHDDRQMRIYNFGNSPIVFNVSATKSGAIPQNVHLSSSAVFVPPHGWAPFDLSLSVPVSGVGGTHDAMGNLLFTEVGGYLTFSPSNPGMNNGVSLHVPYYFVPRARSNIIPLLLGNLNGRHNSSANVFLANAFGGISGNADFYAWGLVGKPAGVTDYDTRAVGVQSNISPDGSDSFIVFAVNTFKRFSTPSLSEFDVLVDVDGDGNPDFDVVGIDFGILGGASPTGQYVTAILNLASGEFVDFWLADAPTDGSTLLLPVTASDLGVTPGHPVISYQVQAANINDGTVAVLPGSASFNVFNPSISNALFVPVAPNTKATVPVSVNAAEWKNTPALGLMVVVEDNNSGAQQASLIPVRK